MWWDLLVGTIFFTLWPWPLSLTYFLKTLTLQITFEQWVLELWYFTWVFLVIRHFSGYHYFFHPMTLTFEFDLLFSNFNFANNFWIVSARALIFHMSIPNVIRPIHWYHNFWPCDLDLRVKPIFINLILLITFE